MQTNTPQIRFKGFKEPWQWCKISDISDRYDNLRIPVAANLRVKGNTPYYGANGIQDYVDGYTHDGEFILVAEDGANDLKNYPVNYVNGRIWVNNHAHVLQAKNLIANNKFLGYAIHKADIQTLLVGGSRAKLNAEVLMNINLLIPNLAEQTKIGELFGNFDNLINLYGRKCESLKKIKKAMLYKMFPQNGESTPQIRFKGFTESWQWCKVEDCMKTITDYVAAGSFADIAANVEYKNSPDYAQLVRTVDLKHKFNNKDFVYVNKKAFDYLWRVNLNSECIILPNIGNIGEVYYVEPSLLPYKNNVLGPNAIYLKTLLDAKFIYSLFQAADFQNKLLTSSTSSGRSKFNKTELKEIPIIVPNLAEQQKIGEYFANLDRLIMLHDKKIQKLKSIKTALLNKAFAK